MSHSRGVNSARAEWIVGWTLAYSLWHKAVSVPCGVATRKSLLQWGIFTLPLKSFVSYEGEPFATWHTILYSTLSHQYIFHLPFSLKHVSFHPNHIFWHKLDCAYTFVIISPLSVPFFVGLVQGFNMSLLEVFLPLLNIGRDSPVACIHTYRREKVNQKSRSFPKHEVMGRKCHNHWFHTIVSPHQESCCITMHLRGRPFPRFLLPLTLHSVSKSYINCDP